MRTSKERALTTIAHFDITHSHLVIYSHFRSKFAGDRKKYDAKIRRQKILNCRSYDLGTSVMWVEYPDLNPEIAIFANCYDTGAGEVQEVRSELGIEMTRGSSSIFLVPYCRGCSPVSGYCDKIDRRGGFQEIPED